MESFEQYHHYSQNLLLARHEVSMIIRPSVVRCLPQDDCERHINSVFVTRQMLQKLLKSLIINYLLLTHSDRQLGRSDRTMVKLTGDRPHKPCPERYAEADTKLLRTVAVLPWGHSLCLYWCLSIKNLF